MDLCNPDHTPRVPKLIRDTARSMLRHYPSDFDMQLAARHSPDIFAEKMEDLHRFVMKGSTAVWDMQQAAATYPEILIDDNHEGSTAD